jgi:predicted TIM-barrel fold metal-dependent hydrolase
MKIDIFTHIVSERYGKELAKYVPPTVKTKQLMEGIGTLFNLEARFQIMDKHEGYTQVITMSGQPIESITKGKDAVELAKISNDETAALVAKYPTRFLCGVANLPIDDTDAALKELERAVIELKLKGIMLHAPLYFLSEGLQPPAMGKPLDSPQLLPIYEAMVKYGLPIWIHPSPLYDIRMADYNGETISKYFAWQIFGWPYQDTLAQVRLVFSGILEKYPGLKFINHHGGAMVPFFEKRITVLGNMSEMRWGETFKTRLSKNPREYFKMFYSDTAVRGSTPALMCAHAFYGTDHLVFGTDTPFDMELGNVAIRETIKSIEQMDIPAADKEAVFEGNAKKLLHLD